MTEKLTRIAIVTEDKCRPTRCHKECHKFCPSVRMGNECIVVEKIAWISETLCIGCGICVKKCPFEAIQIINLPKDLEKDTTHRYGPNSFKLHRLPQPRPGQVMGLVGSNGTGKSTALKILSGKLKPNLGKYDKPPEWKDILVYFRGSDLQNYFTKMLEDKMKAALKPQFVDLIPKAVKGKVGEILSARNERGKVEQLSAALDLGPIWDRDVSELSGGELQRFTIAISAAAMANVYMFDEPSSYLDVKQRLKAALVIRSVLEATNYVLVVEHDLAVLDYLSDFVCCLYGVPGAYGVVTMPFSVRDGINIFLAGFIPTENLRFREVALNFKVSESAEQAEEITRHRRFAYPAMTKSHGPFHLTVEAGDFSDSEIIVLLGENGTGKTTFINLLAGQTQPDKADVEIPELKVSYKPQKINPKFPGTVQQLLLKKIQSMYTNPQFQTDVLKPLNIESLMNNEVTSLSGGELQRVALVLALGTPADIYLIDEPSAYLDSEQRLIAAKVIKRYILHIQKTAFVVEHDFIMATYLADRVIVYEGVPAVKATATSPQGLLTGMNKFLRLLNITFRRDPSNHRPRINKLDSQKDREQKAAGEYFFLEDTEATAKQA